MEKTQRYQVYQLDMLPDEGSWVENERFFLYEIAIHADPDDMAAMKVAIFEALQYEGLLTMSASMDKVSLVDYYSSGEWLEVTIGEEDVEPPLFGLKLLEEKEAGSEDAEPPAESAPITVPAQWRAITANMPRSPEDSKWGFWYDEAEDEILARREEDANAVANFLADVLGEAVQTGSYDELDGIPGSAWYITID